MVKSLTRSVVLCLTALLVAVPVFGAETFPYTTPVDADPAARAAAQADLFNRLSAFEGNGVALEVSVPQEELAAFQAHQPQGGPLWIGVKADVGFTFDGARKAQSFGTTTASEGNMVWSGAFRSAGAFGVRLHLENVDLPKGAALYVFDRYGQAFGPYTGQDRKSLWTNTVAGDTIVLQLHLPLGSDRGQFQVSQLSHLGEDYSFGAGVVSRAFCAWNDSCIINAECASIPAAVQPLQEGVAYLLFDLPGGTFLCTGGLLNTTTSSGEPYLLTANHCFSTQSAATSLEAYFQWTVGCGASCGSQFSPPGSVARTNGATLLASSSTTDFTFVELSQSPPGGSTLLGWTTTAVANSNGTNLFRVSHPSGSPQAYSEQSVNTTAGTCGTLPRGNFIYSDATLADTEGGSSGSPVVNSSNQVVGQLFGACGATPSTTCDSDDRTVDGAFANTYSSVESWLDPGSGPPPGGGGCTGTNVWTGTASGGGSLVTPNCSGSGSFQGELACDVGAADLDLFLDKQSCSGWFGCSFSAVASSTSAGCDETVNTNQSNGTYRWRVLHFSGPAESFELCTNQC